jgi:isoleucyl-tRNA synthetase
MNESFAVAITTTTPATYCSCCTVAVLPELIYNMQAANKVTINQRLSANEICKKKSVSDNVKVNL